MKKVFLSVPMDGRTLSQIKSELEYLKSFLGTKAEAVDNFIEKPEGSERLYCLGEAIKKLGECDAILMAHDWMLARGCHVELETALIYGIPKFDFRYSDEADALKRWLQES